MKLQTPEPPPDLLESATALLEWLGQMFPDEPLLNGNPDTEQSFRIKDLRAAVKARNDSESELLMIVQTMLPVLYARCDWSPECADLYHSACEELKKRKISIPSLCKHLK